MKTEFEKWFDSKHGNENKLYNAIQYLTIKSGWNAAIDKCLDIITHDDDIAEIIRKLNDLK